MSVVPASAPPRFASEDGGDAVPSTAPDARTSREVAESAREAEWSRASFMRSVFEGRFRLELLRNAPPPPDPDHDARARSFLEEMEAFTRAELDGDAIDREGWVPVYLCIWPVGKWGRASVAPKVVRHGGATWSGKVAHP